MAVSRGLIDSLDEDFIIQQPVSQQRKDRLLQNYLRERELTRTTEMLFDHAGAFELGHPPAPSHVRDFGFKVIVFKHSFIDGVNSLIVSAQDWAIGQEDFLLHFLDETLREAADERLGVDTERDASPILDALNGMATEMRYEGYSPSAFVISGSLGPSLYESLQESTQNPYDWYRFVGMRPRATHRFIGVHGGIPIVATGTSDKPALYAIDLASFAKLIRYGEEQDYRPEFRVEPFDDDRAREVLERQPHLIPEPPPATGNERERIRQLQLRVGIELWEKYQIDVKDSGAVIARPLADPVYE